MRRAIPTRATESRLLRVDSLSVVTRGMSAVAALIAEVSESGSSDPGIVADAALLLSDLALAVQSTLDAGVCHG